MRARWHANGPSILPVPETQPTPAHLQRLPARPHRLAQGLRASRHSAHKIERPSAKGDERLLTRTNPSAQASLSAAASPSFCTIHHADTGTPWRTAIPRISSPLLLRIITPRSRGLTWPPPTLAPRAVPAKLTHTCPTCPSPVQLSHTLRYLQRVRAAHLLYHPILRTRVRTWPRAVLLELGATGLQDANTHTCSAATACSTDCTSSRAGTPSSMQDAKTHLL